MLAWGAQRHIKYVCVCVYIYGIIDSVLYELSLLLLLVDLVDFRLCAPRCFA